MIKTLQKKFIFTAMIAITVLLAVLLSGINIINAWSNANQTTRQLDIVSNRYSKFAEPAMPASPDMPMPDDHILGMEGDKDKDRHNDIFGMLPMSENAEMAAIYFTVNTDGSGAITKTDISRISSVTIYKAAQLFQEAFNSGESKGKIEEFKYKAVKSFDSDETVYIFLDTSMQTYAVMRVAALSVLIGVVCWFAMLLFVILLSKKMIKPIAENMERQKQFITDAGHEIKTPLAIIISNTDAMELLNGESKWSRNIRNQAVRLSGLTENLLTLARLDESRDDTVFTQVDLSAVVSDMIHMFDEAAQLRNLSIHKFIQPSIKIKGVREQVYQLVSILTDNAVKYAASDSTITVSVSRSDKLAVLTFRNICTQLPDCDPEKLFDRFYRADTARTQKNGGYGIGLSAARAIVQQHGGTVNAEYEGENVIVFTAKLQIM
ncbi:MAG: sensor histidine kinase [Acutalibacteraceae bacterium]